MNIGDVDKLACPRCASPVVYSGALRAESLFKGELGCCGCGCAWPVRDGLPWLFDEASVRSDDSWSRSVYDWLAPLHDMAVTYVLPFLQLSTEAALRQAYMARLELESLRRRSDGAPLRVLEVGSGCGANLPLLANAIAREIPVEVWAVDLSEGMMRQCRRSHRFHGSEPIRYALADAHSLPFPRGMFDRVFHVGGIAGFGDPARALAEMARVARPGTPIVVVDEQLGDTSKLFFYQRVAFDVFAWFAPYHGAPVKELPRDACEVLVEQISAFYYCLRFQMPQP